MSEFETLNQPTLAEARVLVEAMPEQPSWTCGDAYHCVVTELLMATNPGFFCMYVIPSAAGFGRVTAFPDKEHLTRYTYPLNEPLNRLGKGFDRMRPMYTYNVHPSRQQVLDLIDRLLVEEHEEYAGS